MRHLWLGFHLMPLEVVDADMPYLRDIGLAGFDLPLGFVGIWTKAPNAYVVARKCWDADADRAAIVTEYFRLYYGESAAEARRACELAEKALPGLRYGSNFSLIWSGNLLTPRTSNPRGLLAHAEGAAARLQEAADIAARARGRAADPVVKSRLLKLETAVKHAQREQEFLHATASLAALVEKSEGQPGGKEEKALRDESASHLDRLARIVGEMQSAYRVEDDLCGLLWSGASHSTVSGPAAEWKALAKGILSGILWQEIGTWRTNDFPDKDTVIAKEVDIGDYVSTAGPVFVRWQWTGGQLGIDIYETSLWEISGTKRTRVSRDVHRGFTGAQNRYPLYRLKLARFSADSRYVVVGRIQARAGHGTVAARGSHGKIILGVRTPDQKRHD